MNRWCDACDAVVQPLPSGKCPVHSCETRSIAYLNEKAAPSAFAERFRKALEASGKKVIDADPNTFDFDNNRLGSVGDES